MVEALFDAAGADPGDGEGPEVCEEQCQQETDCEYALDHSDSVWYAEAIGELISGEITGDHGGRNAEREEREEDQGRDVEWEEQVSGELAECAWWSVPEDQSQSKVDEQGWQQDGNEDEGFFGNEKDKQNDE